MLCRQRMAVLVDAREVCKMTKKYLKKFWFYWDVPGLLGENIKRTSQEQKVVTKIDNVVRNTCILNSFIVPALKEAKPQVGEPPLIWTEIKLKKSVKAEPYLFSPIPSHPGVFADVSYDPLDLLHLPQDKDYIGELYISWVEEALSKLQAIPDFPCDVIRNACDKFRGRKYNYTFRAGEKMIPNTRIKGQIWVVSNGLGTQRYFEALYRNKRLFTEKISEESNVEMTISGRFDGFEYENGIVTVRGDKYHPFPETVKPILIDFKEHPEAYALLQEKGWVT